MRPEEHRELYNIEDDYWWFKAKRHLLIKTVERTAKGLNGNGHLLDTGCGTGANLKEISRFLPVVGVEKYFEALKFCKKRNLDNLLNAEVEHLPFEGEAFDVVLAMDILEHVDDDLKVLKEISRVSKEGAILIIHVPAFMFLWSDHDLAVDHKRRYTAGELVERLKESNFKVKSMNYRLCSFFILGVLKKYLIKLKKLIKKDSKPQAYRPDVGKILNNILYIIVKMEDHILNFIRLPFGLSILCIAQKDSMESKI